MAVFLATYATMRFFQSQKLLETSALSFGVDEVLKFNSLWLWLHRRSFLRKNWRHFLHRKGAGFWVWKPFIISKCLEVIGDEDFLIYFDAGIEVVKPLEPLLQLCRENDGILLFTTFYYINQHWTKRDTFKMLGCDTPDFWQAKQLEAGMLVLNKSKRSLAFIQEWLAACEQFQLVSDAPNRLGFPNLQGFRQHRHDQSILSLLAKKHGIEPHRSPHQFCNNLKIRGSREPGEYLDDHQALPSKVRGKYAGEKMVVQNSPYPTLLNLHRRRNKLVSWQIGEILSAMRRDADGTENWLRSI